MILLDYLKDNSPEKQLDIARAFGFKTVEGLNTPEAEIIRKELDFRTKMNKDSSPFFVFNRQNGGIPTTQDELNHHPNHAKALKDRAEEVGAGSSCLCT